MRTNTYYLFLGLLAIPMLAQKGMPPGEQTSVRHETHYPQHKEFSPGLLGQLKTPDGWKVSIAATGLGKPRMLYPANGGGLYITRRDAGDVLLLKPDPASRNKFTGLQTVVAEFDGVHGITARDNWLYLCNSNELRRYPLNADGSLGEKETLFSDMPSGGQHPNRTMDWGPDGKLYISVGSTCNDCKESDETTTMLQVDPATWKRTVFATGLRNTIGFDWHPATGELWGVDNGGDAKGEDWPPEELNRITMGGDYGFPYVYEKQKVDESREEPVGSTKEAYARKTVPSVMEFPAHSAPIAFQFFGSASRAFSGDALVAWHGSWNRKNPVGFKVEHIVFKNGVPIRSEDFLSGFLYNNARFGRPAGISITPEGVVYVSDDANGVLYCITKN